MNNKIKIIKGKNSMVFLNILLFFILNSLLVSATVDLVSPEDNTYTNQQSITFEYYVNLDNATNCTLIIDSETSTTNTNITNPGFNEFIANLNEGAHTWSITCNAINSSENSEQRTLTIDTIEPTIILVSPLNNTQIKETSADISFIVINTPAENSSCDIILNNSVGNSIIAEDSEPTITTLTDLSDGLYEWKITCYDQANNSETSEIRTFKVNTTILESEPEFSISIPKTEYVLGEYGLMTISAPNGTSIRVEVCPDKPGFVECEVPVNAQNVMNYPFQEYLPFYTQEGKYLLEAYFNYSGTTDLQELNYEVKNNINIDIDVDEDPRIKVPLTLEADASGGIGDLDYTWHLSNGSKVNDDQASITYETAGDYTETVVVKDSYNNTRNKSITIDVSDAYHIEIIVKDSATNAAIKKASVEIEDEQKKTDTYGKVNYYLREGRREILTLKENYSIYLDELNITKDQTFTILLEPLANTNPIITLLRPGDNSRIIGPTNELAFKAQHENALNCSIYINENNDGFFIYLGSLRVSDSSEQRFGVIELENKTYWWKVECADNKGNSGISDTWEFTVGNEEDMLFVMTNQESGNIRTYNNWVKEFEQVLDVFENLPNEERETAESLEIIKTVKDTIKIFKNTMRDLDSIDRRNELSEEEKQAEKEKLAKKAEEAYQKTPVNIEVLNSDAFVDYIDQTELTELLGEYLKIKNVSKKLNQKKVLDFLDELQQEVVISTKTQNVRITYKDETKTELTVVIREIKTYNITEGAFVLEVIPKDVIQTADDIISFQEYDIIKQDPIIKFRLKGDTTLVYYFENSIDLELLKNIRTAVFIDLDSIDDKITGFSTKKFKLPKLKGIIFIPVIIILLGGLVFVGIKYNGFDTAKYVYYKLHGHKNSHYVNVVLNEITDNLDVGNVEKALELYEEAKNAYSQLSALAKNDVYEKVAGVATKIGDYCQTCQTTENKNNINKIKGMVENIQSLLNNAQLIPALEEYKKIESAYNQLDEGTKEMLHPSLVALGNKIQIIIENEKDKI